MRKNNRKKNTTRGSKMKKMVTMEYFVETMEELKQLYKSQVREEVKKQILLKEDLKILIYEEVKSQLNNLKRKR